MKNLPPLFIFALVILLSGLGTTAVFADEGAAFSLRMISSEAVPPNQSYYILESQSGVKLENSIRVINSGTATGTARLYPVDMTTAQTGGSVFGLHDDPLAATGTWITLAVSELTLAAGESRDIPFSVTIPADARAGHHVGGIVAEVIEQKAATNTNDNVDSTNFQVIVQSRSAVAVQVNVPGTNVEQIDVMGIAAGGQGGHQTLVIGMSNSGNVMLKPTGQLVVSNEAGTQVQDIQFSMDTFLPETAIDYPLFIENEALAAGEYLADLTLQYGENQESTQQLSFTIAEAQVSQVFEGREALSAPASATDNTAKDRISWREVFDAPAFVNGISWSGIARGLLVIDVTLFLYLLYLIGIVFYLASRQSSH